MSVPFLQWGRLQPASPDFPTRRSYCRALPKYTLHGHRNESVRPEYVTELLRQGAKPAPGREAAA